MRLVAISLWLALVPLTLAQAQEQDSPRPGTRVRKLEQEVERLRSEVAQLRSEIAQLRQSLRGVVARVESSTRDQPSEAEIREALEASDLPKALALAQRSVRAQPSAISHALLGEVLLSYGDRFGSKEQLEAALRFDSDNRHALLLLSEVLIELGDLEEASPLVHILLGQDPRNSDALYLRGLVFLRQDKPQFDLAIRDFSRVIELDSRNVFAYFQRGVARYSTRRFGVALEDLKRSLDPSLQPRGGGKRLAEAEVHYVSGFCHYYREEFQEAIAAWKKFLSRAPSTHRGRPPAAKYTALAEAKLAKKGSEEGGK